MAWAQVVDAAEKQRQVDALRHGILGGFHHARGARRRQVSSLAQCHCHRP
jgi:hypothetical protein